MEVTELSIYPNPSSDQLFIEHPNSESETVVIFVFDELGKQVLMQTNNLRIVELPISTFPTGIYFIKVIYPSNDSLIFFGKFIKN